MKTCLVAVCAVLLASCASAGDYRERHPGESGCHGFPIAETLMGWRNSRLSTASFRFAVDPDSGQGPTTLVVIDSGRLVNLANPDNDPFFLGAIGDSDKTCVVRMPLRDCPAAAAVYDRLKGLSIPLGFGMDEPADLLVFHAPTYYLEFSDGQANHNQWRFYGMNHPLQAVINESIDALQGCLAPALDAYGAR